MREGVAVRHPQYGSGVIISTDARRGANVDFGYAAAWVPLKELKPPDGVEDSLIQTLDTPERVSDGAAIPKLSPEVAAARRAILALKLGQVLEENVQELSVGTDGIQAEMERAIVSAAQRHPQSLIVKGSWGTGKTHLLTLLTKLAADKEFATATVILDGEGVTLSEPMGLMKAILSSLRYPGEAAPCSIGDRLADFQRRLSYHEALQNVGWRIADAIFCQIPSEAFNEPEAVTAIEDYFMLALATSRANEELRRLRYKVSLPSLKEHRVYGRPKRFCQLLKGWAGFCTLTGAKGLAVVFDEVDVEYAVSRGGFRPALLKTFDDLLQETCPIVLAFGSAPASDDVGDSNDAVEGLARSIKKLRRVEAPAPNVKQTKELGGRLYNLYFRAYPESLSDIDPDETRRQIDRFADRHHKNSLAPTIREFVRGTLEILDVVSHRKGERGKQG